MNAPADKGTFPSGPHSDNGLAVRIGARLRELRLAQGQTLSALSSTSGVSVSYLSAVEKGVNLPSLQKLGAITAALGVGLRSVLATEGESEVRHAALPSRPATVDASAEGLLLRVALLRTRSGQSGPSPVPAEGRDLFIFVREGHLDVWLGDAHVRLGPGDAAQADAPSTARWSSPEPAVAVWSSCPSRLS